jgi:hypothetical protein
VRKPISKSARHILVAYSLHTITRQIQLQRPSDSISFTTNFISPFSRATTVTHFGGGVDTTLGISRDYVNYIEMS